MANTDSSVTFPRQRVPPVTERVARLIRPEVRALSAYRVPDPQGMVKLDAMENPYGWPAPMVESWLERLRRVSVNRYPDPQASALKDRLGFALQVPPGQSLLLGNGSDELIQLVALALAAPETLMLAPEPSFVMYRMIAAFVGMKYAGVPLREDDFQLDLEAMGAALAEHRPAVIFLAYPNNPTGNLFREDHILEIIAATPGIVVIDEAYYPFAEASFMQRLGEFDNLLVMRTLSKMGLAGLRLGVLAGPAAWLEELEKLRLPYNINSLTQASADFALQHLDVFDAQAQAICAERARVASALAKLEGVTVYPSKANFILFRVPAGQAPAVFATLRAHQVLIKSLAAADRPLADCLRVTIGTPEENEQFLRALRQAIIEP